MSYRNTAVKTDTELKQWWCQHGEQLEHEFIQIMTGVFRNFKIEINPKKFTDPTAPDLKMKAKNGISLGDLKSQRTPFFSAGKYGLDPQFTFTFNVKDYHRYIELYDDLNLLIWVKWEQTEMTLGSQEIKLYPMNSIYHMTLKQLVAFIEENNSPIHHYKRRPVDTKSSHPLSGMVDSKGNATSSYLIDLRRIGPLVTFH